MTNRNHFDFETEALLKWWRGLDEHRGRRARLSRCHTLDEVKDTLAFQGYARPRLLGAGLRGNDEQLAAVAGLLAHIREHATEHRAFAAQMAMPGSAGGRPPVSEVRFRRLLRKPSRAKLYRPLRRVLHILGTPPRANIFEVAQDVYYWGDGVRRRWAEDYHAVLLEGEQPIREVSGRKATWQAWWQDLDERRGERAALRRCHTLHEVMLTSGYHRLLHYLRKTGTYDESDKWQHAAVAGLLAHVEENDERHRFAAQMALSDQAADALAEADGREEHNKVRGRIQSGKLGSAPLSGLRFRRLLQINDRPTLFRKLIRTLHLLGGKAKVTDVADAAFYWGDDRRRCWSLDYYTHAPFDEP